MGNAFALIIKYGQYLKYLPLLVKLIAFIREAEQKFRSTASGADKAAWVQEQFSSIVDGFEAAGLFGAKFAQALRDGSLALISIFVQGIKDVSGGVIPPLSPLIPGGPKPGEFQYERPLDTRPTAAQLKTGDLVYQFGEESKWMARQGGVGIGKPPAPWRLIETIA